MAPQPGRLGWRALRFATYAAELPQNAFTETLRGAYPAFAPAIAGDSSRPGMSDAGVHAERQISTRAPILAENLSGTRRPSAWPRRKARPSTSTAAIRPSGRWVISVSVRARKISIRLAVST